MPGNKIATNLGASLTGEDKLKIEKQKRSQDILTTFNFEGDPGRVKPPTIVKTGNHVNNFILSPGRDRLRAKSPVHAKMRIHVNSSHKGDPDRDKSPENAKVGGYVNNHTFNLFSSVNKKSIDNGDKMDTSNISEVEFPEVEKFRGGVGKYLTKV